MNATDEEKIAKFFDDAGQAVDADKQAIARFFDDARQVIDADKQAITKFFDDARPYFDTAKQKQAQADLKDATAFSVCDYFRTHTDRTSIDERTLSRIFANLLNPAGTHGQGNRFLSLFLNELNLSKKYPASDMQNIATEHQRLDIVLEFANSPRWLGIENKPWAPEGEGQCKRYLESLQAQDEEAWLCYFSGDGSRPPSLDDSPNASLHVVPYRKTDGMPSIEKWLEQSCQACEAEQVRCFLKDLRKYIQWKFESKDSPRIPRKEKVMEQAIANFITGHIKKRPEDLDLARAIEKAMPTVRKNLIVDFIERIEKKLYEWINAEGKGRDNCWKVYRCHISEIEEIVNSYNLKESLCPIPVALHKTDWKPKREEPPGATLVLGKEKEDGHQEVITGYLEVGPYHHCLGKAKFCGRIRESLVHKTKLPWDAGDPLKYFLEGNLQNWFDSAFLKIAADPDQAESMAATIARQLCEVAEVLDNSEEYKAIM